MKTIFTILLASLLATSAYSQTAATVPFTTEHRAWIAAERQGDMLSVQGKFTNDGEQDTTLRYELVTVKQGTSGSSRSAQSGEFRAPAGQEVSLSNTTVNVSEGDIYVIELKIFRGDTVYLEDKIEYQG